MDLEDVEVLMKKALAVALEWKGMAMAARPALKIALHLLDSAPKTLIMCPWCCEFISCKPSCFRLAAVKAIRDAMGDPGYEVLEEQTQKFEIDDL